MFFLMLDYNKCKEGIYLIFVSVLFSDLYNSQPLLCLLNLSEWDEYLYV